MEFVKVDGEKLKAGSEEILLKGFGLGGWLLPEGYMWKLFTKCDRPRRMEQMLVSLCGEEYAQSFWRRYLDTYITKEDIEWIAGEGFNCIRLPLNARHLYKDQSGADSALSYMLRRVDELIKWCKQYGIYVILDMHAAPGGQTGQNIDDSEDDTPRLFMDIENRDELCRIWRDIARRYADEPAVAGYDLLNEPLPNQFSEYNDRILPLYKDLTAIIREVDTRHTVMLEGAHWATDFSIFDPLSKGEISNAVLQFHKYWNAPDEESLAAYLACAQRLGMPLLMGEGGENNLAWYTSAFPLYEKNKISWSFWTYKKMSNNNSPVSFAEPAGWDVLIDLLNGGKKPGRETAKTIFDNFLFEVAHSQKNTDVIRALKREVPLEIPCEAYDGYKITSNRRRGAELRMHDPVTLLFANGKTGVPDYRRYNGEPQPEEENIVVELLKGEVLTYRFVMPQSGIVSVNPIFSGDGDLHMCVDNCGMKRKDDRTFISEKLHTGEHTLSITCISSSIKVDTISLSIEDEIN